MWTLLGIFILDLVCIIGLVLTINTVHTGMAGFFLFSAFVLSLIFINLTASMLAVDAADGIINRHRRRK